MLCVICNDNILQDDDINRVTCKEFFHFNSANLRDASFRKMSKMLKGKWSYSACELKKTPISVISLP